MWRRIADVSSGLVVALLAGSYLGVVHSLGDSLAVVRPAVAVVACVLAAVLGLAGRRRLALLVLAAGSAAGLPVLWSSLPGDPGSGAAYHLYQKNLSFRLADPSPLIADIRGHAPDFVTLQEVTGRTRAVMAGLADVLPSQHMCTFAAVGGVAVLSRWPMIAGSERCVDGDGLVAMRVTTPDGPVWVVSIHLHWPFPYRQPEQVPRLLAVLATMAGPMLVGGDFNMVPWSDTLARIAQATGTERAGSILYTLPLAGGLAALPIDHVLVSRGKGTTGARRLPLLGSDHHGVLAGFALGE